MQVPPSEHPAEDSPDSYANGVLTYAQEIASRTEQYWRPVKHATDPAAPHARYADFVDHTDAAGFLAPSPALRAAVQAPGRRPSVDLEGRVEALSRALAPFPIED